MNYVSVRTATLRPGSPLLFDVYVLFRDEYLKYRANSETFEASVLERLRSKKVKKVYILDSQEPDYLKYLDEALVQLEKKDIDLGSRAEFAQDTLKQEADNIDKTLESEEAYRNSESRIQKVVEFILSEPKALAGMLSAAGLSIDDSAHGSTVSSLALGVGARSGAVKKEELTDMAVAGLLHDTGLKALGFDTKSDLNNVSKDKRTDFRKHPAAAIQQVAGKKFITPRVLRLIEDHEEFGDGLGFPEKKRYVKLALDSKIFNLCDAFDHYCIQSGIPAAEAIELFIAARADHFDLSLMETLEKLVKA
jgi:HD-GYP domain-containing protein (c-di-GMP phosphodiesterase class II)